MKPQKEITSSIALLFLAQNLFFPLGVQAQTAASQVVGAVGAVASQIPAIYSQQPASPGFVGMSASIQGKMNLCLTQGLLGLTGDATKDATNVQSSADQWAKIFGAKKSGDSEDSSDPKKMKVDCKVPCSTSNPIPTDEPDCSIYGPSQTKKTSDGNTETDETGRTSTKFDSADNKKTREKDRKQFKDYIACEEAHKTCADADSVELQKQLATFQCQMGVLSSAVQQAAQELNRSLMANQKTFTDMNLHQKEVGEQINQVDSILGPDPELGKSGNSQMQGLLGLQKELNDSMPKMEEADAGFKTDIAKLKADTTTNEQNLEAARVNTASQCIKGSRNVGVAGGYSLTCFKPVQTTAKDGTSSSVTDRNGNVKYTKQSCGPYEYIRSKIEQQAFITNRGVMMTQDRRDQSTTNATAFDALADSINRAMGDYSAKGADNALLDSNVHSWSDIETQLSSNIDAVASQSGVDVRSMLRSVAGHCFQEADSWKNQQIRSTGSDYNKKKTDLAATQTALTSKMDTGISALNKSYGDVMAVLSGQAVTLDRSQCTKDNPDLMEACFAKIRQNVQDLLEGNGSLTATSKTIKGGTSTPPLVVSCRGLNGCVTAFKSLRDERKAYIAARQKDKEAFVNQSNTVVQQQLTGLTSQLSNMQNSLLTQYDKMKATMMGMGVDAPDKPKFMTGEALQASAPIPPDNTPGPFQNPKNMSSALSQMMQPAGMIDFSDTGLRDPMKDVMSKAADKKKVIDDEIARVNSLELKFEDSKIKSSCQIVAGASTTTDSKKDNVVNDFSTECGTCDQSVQKCVGTLSNPPNGTITYQDNINTLDEMEKAFHDLSKSSKTVNFSSLSQDNLKVLDTLNGGSDCSSLRFSCNQCATDGKKSYTEDPNGGTISTLKANP